MVKGKKRTEIAIAAGEGIEHLKPEDLLPDPKNARIHTESQVKQIAYSIKTFGFNAPIVIDEYNNVHAGHGRLMAANELKLPVVPCIRRSGLTAAQWKAFQLADNRISLNAQWDMDLLADAAKVVDEGSMNLTNIGFDTDEIRTLLSTTIELPDTGDAVLPGSEQSEDDLPELEDANVAVEEMQEVTGAALQPAADPVKERYHQLPPEDATRGIRASEERTPLAILVNREEHDVWLTYKAGVGAKSDKQAWQILMGLREPERKDVPADAAPTENDETQAA